MKKLWTSWEQFWFSYQNLLGLAYMRIFVCGTLLYMALARFYNIEFYTNESWIPRSLALKVLPELGRPFFLWSFWPDSFHWPMNLVLVILLSLLTVGIGGRWIMWLAWVINAGFIQRNYGINFGADIIANLFLFYMAFTQSCERLSLLNWNRRKTSFAKSNMISSMMVRMMQVQICVIYAYTGWEKLKGASWWDGTALWTVMANPQMTTMDFSFLRHTPWIIPILVYMTIIFEVYFPVMVAWRKTRYLWLLLGLGFHAGIGLFMGLGPFAFVMIATYFIFIDSAHLERMSVSFLDFFKKRFRSA